MKRKEIQDIARAMETSVNAMHNSYIPSKRKSQKPSITCYRCGRVDTGCPARTATCRKCKKVGHFEKVCKTKGLPDRRPRAANLEKYNGRVNEVEDHDTEDYAFSVNALRNDHFQRNTVSMNVRGVTVDNTLIDSGATCNIVDKKTYLYLKGSKINCVSKKTERSLYAYGSQSR